MPAPTSDDLSAWLEVLNRSAHEAAPMLLGARLATRDGIEVTLVEVEAYGDVGEDPASHAFRGRTRRNAPMFGPAGHLYVYLSYGIHRCVNVVTGPAGAASAVLLRAAEVTAGEALVRARRASHAPGHTLASGPGRLGQALGITLAESGASLAPADAPLRFSAPPARLPVRRLARGPRIGISQGRDLPWRFWIREHPAVSRGRAPVMRPPATP